MSEFPLWSELIRQESPSNLREAHYSPGFGNADRLTPRSPILSKGTRVRVPHRGRMVSGKVVRFDKGGYVPGVRTGGWPFYVIDTGEYESVKVPVDRVHPESPVVESALMEAPETFAVMAIDDPSPVWKQGSGHTPEQKVVWQMWGLAKNEIGLAAKMARKEHPKATISVENQGGRIVKVFKPGAAITEAEMTDAQMKKREEIVKSMKDKEADFKDRYGDRWKDVMYATATKQAMGEAVERPLKVGDYVHAGLAVKGGAGFSGRVDKIDGNYVYVNVNKDKSVRFNNDPIAKWGDRIIKAPIKNVSLQEAVDIPKAVLVRVYRQNEAENDHTGNALLLARLFGTPQEIAVVEKLYKIREKEGGINVGKYKSLVNVVDQLHQKYYRQLTALKEEDTKYQEYFRAQLKKHGYDSPADIPDDKKDDFFKAVDAGYSAKTETMKSFEVDTMTEAESYRASDDQDMMSSQLHALATKSATIHELLKTADHRDIPAWIQTKVANAIADITAILDYMMFEESDPIVSHEDEPLKEAEDPVVPMRLQAAMVIAKSLGSVKGTGQIAPDIKISGGSPESIVNQAIRVWLQGSHTNEGWALGAKMLKLAKHMGINWDEKLLKGKLAPITLKKLGLGEAEGSAPSGMDTLRQRQALEKDQLALRQEREKAVQQEKDAEEKIRQQQIKRQQAQQAKGRR